MSCNRRLKNIYFTFRTLTFLFYFISLSGAIFHVTSFFQTISCIEAKNCSRYHLLSSIELKLFCEEDATFAKYSLYTVKISQLRCNNVGLIANMLKKKWEHSITPTDTAGGYKGRKVIITTIKISILARMENYVIMIIPYVRNSDINYYKMTFNSSVTVWISSRTLSEFFKQFKYQYIIKYAQLVYCIDGIKEQWAYKTTPPFHQGILSKICWIVYQVYSV